MNANFKSARQDGNEINLDCNVQVKAKLKQYKRKRPDLLFVWKKTRRYFIDHMLNISDT